MANSKSEIKVKSLQKALKVLDCFMEKQPLGVTEISEKLGLYKSNVYDILSTLTAMNYLSRSEESGKYYLGINLVRLGRAAADRNSFQNIVAPHLQKLSKEVGEIAYLTIPLGHQVYYLDTAFPTDSNIHLSSALRNSTDNMNCTSSGKVMLAHMPEEFVEEYLSMPMIPLTEYTITDPGQMREELVKIRLRGYAVDNQENAIGLRCVAVPILGRDGSVLGAMSLSGPSPRFTASRIELFATLLKKHVCEIQGNL